MAEMDIKAILEMMKYSEKFYAQVDDGVYLISEDRPALPGGIAMGKDTSHFGGATGNSYLICGDEQALLIDSALMAEHFRKYAEEIAKMPVMLALSHGHIDHICRLCEFEEFWVHPADEALIRGAYGNEAYPGIPKRVHYLMDGDVIDLGGRLVDVIWLPGHTDGSILFYDRRTKLLFSGDTVTRRLLYGSCGWVPFTNFARSLYRLKEVDIAGVYSCHDRPMLQKDQAVHMIREIVDKLPAVKSVIDMAVGRHKKYIWLKTVEENDAHMIDFSAPTVHREELLADIKEIRENPVYAEIFQ